MARFPAGARRVEYDIGSDRYARRTRLVGEIAGGAVYWSIISEPANQRDDGEKIHSLTTPQMKEIARLAAEIGGQP